MIHRLALVALFTGCVAQDVASDDPPEVRGGPVTTATADPSDPESATQEAARLIADFQRCMHLADFQRSGMHAGWTQIRGQNNQDCVSCHSAGTFGFVGATEQAFFDDLKTNRYDFLYYFTVDLQQHRVVIDDRTFMTASTGIAPYSEHPRFSIASGQPPLQQFYDLTMARLAAGDCQ